MRKWLAALGAALSLVCAHPTKRALVAIGAAAVVLCASLSSDAQVVQRKRLAAATTFYVATTGSNSANCLTVSTPCETMQYVWDMVADGYDANGQLITIQLADGTYTAGLLTQKGIVGQDGPNNVVIRGNTTTPANVVISTTNASAFEFGAGTGGSTQVRIRGMKLQTTTSGHGIIAFGGNSVITFSEIDFGTTANFHIDVGHSAFVMAVGNYAVSGSAVAHVVAASNGVYASHGLTVTYSNAPAFSLANYYMEGGRAYLAGMTFTNGATVTGSRYYLVGEGHLSTGTCDRTYLPGNVAGTETAGVYNDCPRAVTAGGMGLAAGTSGGVPYYSATTTIASSGALTANGVVLGGGAGATPTSTAVGTTGQVLTGVSASAPTWQSIRQALTVSGADGFAGGTTAFMVNKGSTTEAVVSTTIPVTGTFRNMYINVSTAPVGVQTVIATLRVNGSDTAVTCTITGAATSCSDTSNSAAVTAGQLWSIKVVYSATAASSVPKGGVQLLNP